MIIDSKNSDLMNEYKKACEDETAAITALHEYISSPSPNMEIMVQLSDAMENAHNKSMDIRGQLEAVRIDK